MGISGFGQLADIPGVGNVLREQQLLQHFVGGGVLQGQRGSARARWRARRA